MAFQKLWFVGKVSCGARENRNIAIPAHPFVALRTVGRYGQKVAPQRPCDILPKFVHFWVRCFIFRSQFFYRADYQSLYRFQRQDLFNSCNFDKPVTMKGKPWLNHLVSAFQRVNILSHCRTDVFEHYHAHIFAIFSQIGVFYLGVTQCYFLTCSAVLNGNLRNTDHVLPHVVHKNSGSYFFNTDSCEFINNSGIFAILSGEREFVEVFIRLNIRRRVLFDEAGSLNRHSHRFFPVAVIKSGFVPTGNCSFFRCIVNLTLEKAAVHHRSIVIILPVFGFGGDFFRSSVGVGNH